MGRLLDAKDENATTNAKNWDKNFRNSYRMNVTVKLLDDIVQVDSLSLKGISVSRRQGSRETVVHLTRQVVFFLMFCHRSVHIS